MSNLTCVHGQLPGRCLRSCIHGLAPARITTETSNSAKELPEISGLSAAVKSFKEGRWRDAITTEFGQRLLGLGEGRTDDAATETGSLSGSCEEINWPSAILARLESY